MIDIETPCNKVCAVDPVSALCIGCGRTVAEIGGWIGFRADQRASWRGCRSASLYCVEAKRFAPMPPERP